MDYYGNLNQQAKAQRFIEAIKVVCRSHGCWLSHEDDQGGFEIVVDPVPADIQMLSNWFGSAEVDIARSTGCSHTWVKDPDRPFDDCTSCKAVRRHITNEIT